MRVARLSVVASIIALLCLTLLALLASPVAAQVTTATVRGVVQGAEDGVSMAGVEVTLVDVSTGAVKTTTTNDSGEFAFTAVPIGGPYHLKAELMGFRPAEDKDIFLSANKTHNASLGLKLQEEVIEVSGTAITRNTSNRTLVTAQEIDLLPSVGRDPRDVVRRNPEVTVEGSNKTLSIGGANNRFNSITVDGTRQDDDFGLNASGLPTRRSPIGLSAIQELSVDTSPFDVHYGKFLGGNVNIVTKSGSNEFKGTLVGTYTSDSFLGSKTRDDVINVDYSELRYGATVGGPIVKDKVHFLASIEGLNATTPIDNGPEDSTASNRIENVSTADMLDAIRIANQVYNFNAGVSSQSSDEADLKLLAKVDWRINPQHRASVTFQRTNGNNIQIGGGRPGTLLLSSNWYDARDTLNTFAGRLFSDWSEQLSTQVEASAKLVSSRVPSLNGGQFMSASINTMDGGSITLGPDISRHANALDNDVFFGRAEANYLLGTHLLTAGVAYELTRIRNTFLQRAYGEAVYATLADFEAMRPQSIVYKNSTTLDPFDAAANWNVGLWTGYVQDQLKLTNELTVNGGVRLEMYQSSDRSPLNQNFVDRYNFGNNASLNGRGAILPRLGLSWLPVENLNVRAGGGVYSGGTPAVWMSNNYTNDGTRTFEVNCTNGPTPRPNAACPDPSVIIGFDGRNIPMAMQQAVVMNAGNGNVDALDPNFKVPSVYKVGTGADYLVDLPEIAALNGLELKANYTFTKVRDSVVWKDLRRNLGSLPNNVPIGNTVDGRPFYPANFNTGRGYDMLLTNDDRGYGHVGSIVVQKGFPFGLFVSGSYAYTQNWEVSPGTSSVSTSNYGLAAVVDPQRAPLAVSNYERRHRFTAALEYTDTVVGKLTDAKPWKAMKTNFSMFVESRSGQPYSWTFGGAAANLGAIFGEEFEMARRSRQLFYVPLDNRTCEAPGPDCDVILGGGVTKEQFNDFLDKTGLASYRGRIAPRNAFKSPRVHRFDVRIAQDLPNPLSGHRARFVLDVENVGNLFNAKWGRVQGVPFPYAAQAVDVAVDRNTGVYTYTNLRSSNPTRPDTLQSVWRVGVGLMYDF
jgi:hypothetical protein